MYVAVTRPKNRLFIYDEVVQDRRAIEDIWTRLDVIQWVTKESVQADINSIAVSGTETKTNLIQTEGDLRT